MLTKEEFTKTHPDLRAGLTAYTMEGDRLGVIEMIDDDGITIEKGRIFHRGVHVSYDDIEDIRSDGVFIRQSRENLEEKETQEPFETRESTVSGETIGRSGDVRGIEEEMEAKDYGRTREEEQARVPIREEELEAHKREKQGEVRIHKDVYTETQHLEIPVEKEEVRVEHVPASEASLGETEENAFREQDVRIPVKEEEVEVTKRPVVKEEVRVSKETRTEDQEVSGEVRKERVNVDRTGSAEKKK